VLAFRGPRAKTLVAVEIGTPKTFDAFTTSAGRVLATLR
jgi:hypothetical protein